MSAFILIAISAILGLLGFVLLKEQRTQSMLSRKKDNDAPPTNPGADVLRGTVQETFEQSIERTDAAVSGDSPADDLADLGNDRRRS